MPLDSSARLALSISGGGHRAAAFGLGTIALLQELGLMERVAVLSTVSGGSLVGGFYLCAKAGFLHDAEDSQRDLEHWRNEGFRQRFLLPFLAFLHDGRLGDRLVADLLPIPLGPETKLIRSAAEEVQALLKKHRCPHTLGHEAIRALLALDDCAPDHVYFNAADLTSLDLFRFGVIRQPITDSANELAYKPAYVVNRFCIPIDSKKEDPAQIVAACLRIADCVAASFCFPGGFEPLLFPDDFLRLQAEDEETRAVTTRLCGGAAAVALMDGGLYDNLGLASVEIAIQSLRLAEAIRLKIEPHLTDAERARTPHDERGRIYVLATDVDNIQPANKALDPSSQNPLEVAANPDEARRRSGGLLAARRWTWALLSGVGGALLPLLTLLALPPAAVVWIVRQLPVLRQPLLGWIRRSPALALPLHQLGLVPNSAGATSSAGVSVPLLAGAALLWTRRRTAQVLPAFNGYLKRTRNLTYQYLSYKYQKFAGGEPNTFLLRNLIFELAPGPDSDPDHRLDELTRPLEDFDELGAETHHKANDWISKKLEPIAWLLELPWPEDPEGLLHLPERFDSEANRKRLCQLRADLALDEAVRTWQRIQAVLARPGEPLSQAGEALTCLSRVARSVHSGLQAPSGLTLSGDPLLSQICEMATNLPTTLWLEEFRHYVPNTFLPDGRIQHPGGWYVDEGLVGSGLVRANLYKGVAVDVAVAAGFLNTCFNLLEFTASRLPLVEK
ncbi:patatin-like phospholipase family protein [Synechococcus sp. J7-Johnson]|uniref:patatin-like phospholipase family protein n=1 Tax=Synechococcus sp. J7-Johnson TaxID=2823737 RepID=UPI0020CE2DC2|nr:patatin-like phospholipase family protein [Synechococcus sp. J7-Johnson]MCP9841661.1 patatin-like phospholipase family protein [Synechococcus sp. J7-Johnson]